MQRLQVDDVLERACSELGVGELLYSENFSLFESVSGIELGHPRMDSWVRNKGLKSVEELIQEGVAPTDLNEQQVIGIFDKLITLEAGVQEQGDSMVHNVFTCLYLHRPERLDGNMLMSAWLSSVKEFCGLAYDLVYGGRVCEEEDFHPLTYNLVQTGLKQMKTPPLLKAAIDHCDKMISSTKESQKQNQLKAIRCRLAFKKSLIQGMFALVKEKKLSQALTFFADALNFLKEAQKSISLGSTDPPGFNDQVCLQTVNVQLARTVQPRTVEQGYQYYTKFLESTQYLKVVPRIQSYGQLFSFLSLMSQFESLATVRSMVHMLLLDRQEETSEWISDCTCLTSLKKKIGRKSSSDVTEQIQMFEDQTKLASGNWVQGMLLNTARLRRRLKLICLDWGNMVGHAEAVHVVLNGSGLLNGDDTKSPGPILCWAAMMSCFTQYLYLILGVQLELYATHELPTVYLYASHTLSIGITASEVLMKNNRYYEQHVEGAQAAMEWKAMNSASHLQWLAESKLSYGLWVLLKGLEFANALPSPDLPFNSEKELYAQRFSCFQLIGEPRPLVYDAYKEHSNQIFTEESIASGQWCDTAAEHFDACINFCNVWIQRHAGNAVKFGDADEGGNIKQLLKVAKQNKVASVMFQKQLEKGIKMVAHVGYGQHNRFLVVGLKSA